MRVQSELSLLPVARSLYGAAIYTRTPAEPRAPFPGMPEVAPVSGEPSTTRHVSRGDNLTRIVRQYLMDQGRSPSNVEVYEGVRAVAAANHLPNPDLIHPGQVLELSVLSRPRDGRESVPVFAPAAALAPVSVPAPPSVILAPVPPRALLDARPIPDPVAPVASPQDPLLKAGGLPAPSAPILVAANAVAGLLPPTEPREVPAPETAPHRHQPAGGGGPIPSDAAIALQRILNSTSNALSVLRGLVEPDPAGENNDRASGPWQQVLGDRARITSEFGTRKDPFTGRTEFHDGIDLAVKRGTAITALRGGEVVFSGWKGGYGNTVIVRHADGLESLYGHAARNHVTAGDIIEAGARLADVGSTGRSTGPHLHLEMRQHGRPVDPRPYLEQSALGQ